MLWRVGYFLMLCVFELGHTQTHTHIHSLQSSGPLFSGDLYLIFANIHSSIQVEKEIVTWARIWTQQLGSLLVFYPVSVPAEVSLSQTPTGKPCIIPEENLLSNQNKFCNTDISRYFMHFSFFVSEVVEKLLQVLCNQYLFVFWGESTEVVTVFKKKKVELYLFWTGLWQTGA